MHVIAERSLGSNSWTPHRGMFPTLNRLLKLKHSLFHRGRVLLEQLHELLEPGGALLLDREMPEKDADHEAPAVRREERPELCCADFARRRRPSGGLGGASRFTMGGERAWAAAGGK